jgi:hypothetical protein
MNTPHVIKLVLTRKGCAICEKEDRLDVMLNGVKVGQLYWNLRGYRGTLPMHDGRNFDIGEISFTACKKEAAKINREAVHAAMIGGAA